MTEGGNCRCRKRSGGGACPGTISGWPKAASAALTPDSSLGMSWTPRSTQERCCHQEHPGASRAALSCWCSLSPRPFAGGWKEVVVACCTLVEWHQAVQRPLVNCLSLSVTRCTLTPKCATHVNMKVANTCSAERSNSRATSNHRVLLSMTVRKYRWPAGDGERGPLCPRTHKRTTDVG